METGPNFPTQKRANRGNGFGVNGQRQGSLFAGVVLVTFGVGLLLQNFGILRLRNFLDFWPVFPVIWGINVISRGRSLFSYVVGSLAIALGTIKLLDNLDVIQVGGKFYGPVILIGIGVIFLFRNLGIGPAREGSNPLGDNTPVDQDHINPAAVFGGVKRRVVSQQLESGEVMALFGGVELDFRPARMKAASATIEVNAIFGGIKIRIPETWSVELRGTAVAGGFEDKTITAPQSVNGEPAPKLILTGNAMFGGVEVEN